MKHSVIDINVDLGEGLANEAIIMPFISSCNIACGGHAGDRYLMKEVVMLAKQHNVKIGAHPSFPDKENFGRKVVTMNKEDLFNSIKNQITDLANILQKEKIVMHHVKPHGALYNLATVDKNIASVIIDVLKTLDYPVKLYAPHNSVIANIAKTKNILVIYEAFADRNYNDDLTLVSRKNKNAVLQNTDAIFEHVYRIISTGHVKTMNNLLKPIEAQTFCIHGDHPNVERIVKSLVKKMKAQAILVN